jgi:copper chaperone CopZ
VRVAVKHVNGVQSVNVSLEKGLADVTLAPGNHAKLADLRDAIGKNGFTAKQSQVEVIGVVLSSGGRSQLKVTGTDELLDITSADPKLRLEQYAGKTVLVSGTVPEAQKGKAPELQVAMLELQK